MMFNFSVQDDTEWKGVETKPIPPSLMPIKGRGGGLLMTNSEHQGLVHYAVKHGKWLSVDIIRKIFRERGWDLPPPTVVKTKKGSYKTRRRPDWVHSFIPNLFPAASDEEKTRMIALQLKSYREAGAPEDDPDDVDGACPESILEVISGLDPENAHDAKGLRRECFERLMALKESRPSKEDKAKPEASSGWKKENYTPAEFKSLLPPADKTIFIKRLPGQSCYSGFYDRGSV